MVDIYYIIDNLATRCGGLGGVGEKDVKINKATEAKLALGIIQLLAKDGSCHGDGAVMVFDSRKYVLVNIPDMMKILTGLLVKLGVGGVYIVGSVDKIYQSIIRSPLIKEFTQQRGIVALQNVVLDMDTMKTYPHDSQWMTRIYIDVAYDPLATCDWWRRWLTEMVADEESISVMQEFFGMAFVDRNRISIECVLFLYGKGSNGKSVVQQVITGLLGEDACDATDLAQICTENGSSDYHAADINGKLINFSSDMGDKNFSGGRFKSIASHQPIKVRPIHRDPFVARDMPLLAACINKLPITTDSSDGYWRRNKIVLFDKTIAEKDQDKYLATKILAAESSGILNWIMEGRSRLLARNGQFTESKKIMETVSQAREDSSSVLSWIKEAMYCGRLKAGQVGYEEKELSTVMVEQYREFCRKTGCLPKKMSNMKDDLEQAGFIYEKCVKKNGITSTGWRFWRITDMDIGDPVKKETEEKEKRINELPF